MLIRKPSVIPGFRLTLGISMGWLGVIVLLPLAALFLKAASLGWDELVDIVTSERVLAALRLSFGAALAAAALNAVVGLVVSWALVRYEFPGRRVLDAMIDVPFALPTAVAGIALSALYAETGWLGRAFGLIDIKIAFTPLGVFVALVFIGLPFVVRTLQPVLQDLEPEVEEAAASLGASRPQTMWRVVLPAILPALFTGFALAFARAVGEYGSVIFIAGNVPLVSEIAPPLIMLKLEEYKYADATAIAVAMLMLSFLLLLLINFSQRRLVRETVS